MARIAIIGGGLASLACAHFLHREHTIAVFGQNGYTGGASTAPEPDPTWTMFDRATSPLLSRLLDQLELPRKAVPVAFSIRDDTTGLEWSHRSLDQLFAQRRNLLNPRFLKLLRAVHQFNRDAIARLDEPETATQTLGDYVRRRGYGDDFFRAYLLPLGCALWKTPPEFLLSFPAAMVLRFLRDHGLLRLWAQRTWSTVEGGRGDTTARLTAAWHDRLRAEERATRIVRTPQGVTVMTDQGVAHAFDHVIVTAQADHALRLLVNPTPDEGRLLGEFQYQRSTVTLHTDASVLPRTRRAWATWNCQLTRNAEGQLVSATHRALSPQGGSDERAPTFISINGTSTIDPAKILRSTTQEFPLFTPGTAQAQTELLELNTRARGRTETYFAGHYFGCGFPEDELRSAFQLSGLLLGRDPM